MLLGTRLIHFADVVSSSNAGCHLYRKWNAKHARPVTEKSVTPLSKADYDSPVQSDTNDNDR
jgi:hypothetical protein